MKDDFAEASERGEPTQTLSVPAEETPSPAPAERKLPELKGVLMRARSFREKTVPFTQKIKRALHTGWNVLGPAVRKLGPAGRAIRLYFKKDSMPNLVLVLVILTSVIATALSIVHSATLPNIEEKRAAAFSEAMGEVFPGSDLRFTQSSLGENIYEGRDDSGNVIGFSIIVSPNGHAGPIDMIVGVDAQREVTGVTVVYHRETRDFSEAVAQGVNDALESLGGGTRP